MKLPIFLLLPTLLSLTTAQTQDPSDLVLNEYQYCIKYFGTVEAVIDLPSSLPDYNYNGTILCPGSFSTPYISGATLEICPPLSDYGDPVYLALRATLTFRPRNTYLTGPIDILSLAPAITNGSVPISVFNDPQFTPAVLAKDTQESTRFSPVWTVNGTGASFLNSDPTSSNQGVYISCDYEDTGIYCGGYEDQHAANGGCFRSQQIDFNSPATTSLNYTYRFSAQEATVDLSILSEYITYLGRATGENTEINLKFSGTRGLPSVTDYDFWENSESDYEVEKTYYEERKGMQFDEDQEGLPLLVNRTESGEWYDSANGTYSVQSVNGVGRLGVGGGVGGIVLGVVVVVGWVAVL
jgi:hypothetical protein